MAIDGLWQLYNSYRTTVRGKLFIQGKVSGLGKIKFAYFLKKCKKVTENWILNQSSEEQEAFIGAS